MLELLNPVMLAGMAAVTAPIAVHLIHRRRVQQMDWAAMRFLLSAMAKKRRRLMLNDILLLALRCLAIAFVVFALTRPNWRATTAATESIQRDGRVAAIILIDDSLSTSRGRAESVFSQQQALTKAYIETLQEGDEITIIRMSELHQPLADPLYDRAAVLEHVQTMQPSAVASDIPALLQKGLDARRRHFNPHHEIVLVSDGLADGWHPERRREWSELHQYFIRTGPEQTGVPYMLHFSPIVESNRHNFAITGIESNRSIIAADVPVNFAVTMTTSGEDLPEDTLIRLSVGDQVVDEKEVGAISSRQHSVTFSYIFDDTGSHIIKAEIIGSRDALAADDQRLLSVRVRKSVPVLLVENADDDSDLFARPLGVFSVALDPDGSNDGLFQVERIAPSELKQRDLTRFKVLVLGDLATLDGDAVADIERFIVAGGGVFVGLGPQTEADLINHLWAREGDGFLPAPLGDLAEFAEPVQPTVATLAHPVLAAFQGDAAREWQSMDIRAAFDLNLKGLSDAGIETLLRLPSGKPLLVARSRGLGRVLLWTSSFDVSWADPIRAPYVPLMRGAVGWLAGTILPPRNIAPGEALVHLPLAVDEAVQAHAVAGEAKEEPVALQAGVWQGRHTVMSDPIHQAQAIRVDEPDRSVWYAVAAAASESQLQAIDAALLQQTLAQAPVATAATTNDIEALVDAQGGRGWEWWPWLLCAAIACLFAESVLTRRLLAGERVQATQLDREFNRAA